MTKCMLAVPYLPDRSMWLFDTLIPCSHSSFPLFGHFLANGASEHCDNYRCDGMVFQNLTVSHVYVLCVMVLSVMAFVQCLKWCTTILMALYIKEILQSSARWNIYVIWWVLMRHVFLGTKQQCGADPSVQILVSRSSSSPLSSALKNFVLLIFHLFSSLQTA